MKSLAKLTKGIIIVAMTTLIGSAPVLAGTFVYVSNADDGDIGVYSVQTDGSLKPGEHAKAATLIVGPDSFFMSQNEELVALAARHTIPTIYFRREFVSAGGLISYGSSLTESVQRSW